MITVYGIPNCNTVKKARDWLAREGIDYRFHDFKKAGIDAPRLAAWLDAVPLDKLVNRQGTTWRGLNDEDKARAATREGAIGLMMANPSLIKRPVLECRGAVILGFAEERYREALTQ
ncbi:arsenate reductase [Paludibacterium paludis]|uniref:Arsenate reductase n=1 Tax=Paludibacterium paludis TaxID=1225769 RepID=A0A918UAV1_9NEIS|nr:arsenate reductase [Paludibacterium paludis]GGY18989.1 arsenate reductase [Paludibacterium paludis]